MMDFVVELTALGLFGILIAYFSSSLIRQFLDARLSAKTAALESDYLRLKIEQVMDNRQVDRAKNELSWNGLRKFRVHRKVKESKDVCSFYLVPHDGKPLPPFSPGQYLTFEINLPEAGKSPPGLAAKTKPIVRCYSISETPLRLESYRITVKKILPPRDKPDLPPGLISTYFHDHLREGDILDVKAPAGHFCLDASQETPVVLIAGGVGITPLLSMLNTIAFRSSKRETWFFYGVRNRTEHVMKEHLERVALENPNVHLHICYSNPASDDGHGRDYHHGEQISAALFKRLLPSNNYQFYICGPPPMMNQLTQDLTAWGVPERAIFFEAFGPASIKKLVQAARETPEKLQVNLEVTFAKSGKTLSWKPEAGSLLDFAAQNGITTIDSGCRAGNCGTCLTAIKSGEVSYLVEHGAKPEAGSCLTCISVPNKGPLVLDA